jgi:hypothetical protein
MLIILLIFLFYIIFSFWILQFVLSNIFISMHIGVTALFALTGLFFLIHLFTEATQVSQRRKLLTSKISKEDAKVLASVIAGAFITYTLNHSAEVGPVLASSMIGLAAAWTVRNYSLPIYCGTFIGMACNLIFSSLLYIGIASVISGLLYVLSQHFFVGWGGKAGFIAFVGIYFTSIIIGEPLRVVEPLDTKMYMMVFIFSMVACLATFALHSMERMDVVSASALIGLTMAILYPDASHTLVLAAFCGSFSGMTSNNHFTNKTDIFLTSLLTAFLFVCAFSLFDGAGGKLGALAFFAAGATNGIKQLYSISKKLFIFTFQTYKSRRQAKTEQG